MLCLFCSQDTQALLETTMTLDIWQKAKDYIEQHREDAGIHAAQVADKALRFGDTGGCVKWRRVVAAINELQRGTRHESERLN
jgi:hypothetical protein